jgi:ligand-binding sensor domain-containing protein/signal transduction histidine kinase
MEFVRVEPMRIEPFQPARPRGRFVRHAPYHWLGALGLLALVLGADSGAGFAAPADPDYLIQSWGMEDGLPQSSVNAVIQTRPGYLWFGTYNGLVRFDGVRFVVFDTDNTPQFKSNRITSLFEDSQGRLWIGHETGDVTVYEAGQFRAIDAGHYNHQAPILGIGEDEQGRIWLLEANGLLTRLEDSASFPPPASIDPARGNIGFSKGRDGKLWFTRCGQLGYIQRAGPVFINPTGEANPFVQAVCASHDLGLWILTQGYVRKWVNGTWDPAEGEWPMEQPFVSALMELPNGRLLIGSQNSGFYSLMPGGKVEHYNRTNGLSDDWIKSFCRDREGNIWVGTLNGGVNVLHPSHLWTITPPDRWQGRAVLSVCSARDGGLWVGTEGAGLYHFLDGAWEHFGRAEGILNAFIWSVLESADGHLWIGTWGGGLLERTNNRFVPMLGLEDTEPITALFLDRDGVLWAGSGTGLLRLSGGTVTRYASQGGNRISDVRAIAQDPAGTIWFGMLGNGLGCLNHGVLKVFHRRDGLDNEFVQTLHVDRDGALWLGTFGGGLVRMKQGRFVTIGISQGLPSNVILAIEDDGQGHFWMSSYNGLIRVSQAELDQCAESKIRKLHCLVYGRSEGLPTLECSGGFQPVTGRTPDGRMWFPTRKGLVGVSPRAVQPDSLPPTVILEEALVNQHAAAMPTNASPLIVAPGQGRLEFHYTGIWFKAPQRIQFRYWLEGMDPDWVAAGNSRSAYYAYLPPGRYTFHVNASNGDGVWDPKGASLALLVLPQFWQTWWFRGLSGVMALMAVAYVVRLILRRRLRRKMEQLERRHALERERTRIARDIHDELGSSLTNITLLSQAARKDPKLPEKAEAYLDQVYHSTRELTRLMDEIVWAVNYKHDTLESMANYFVKFAQQVFSSTGIRCRLNVPTDLPALALSAEMRHNMFLAFKEALNNVLKHSEAGQVMISLSWEPEKHLLTVKVQDDGRGFEVGEQSGDCHRVAAGNGLPNMFRRIETLKGRCDLASAPGKGTRVTFSVAVN